MWLQQFLAVYYVTYGGTQYCGGRSHQMQRGSYRGENDSQPHTPFSRQKGGRHIMMITTSVIQSSKCAAMERGTMVKRLAVLLVLQGCSLSTEMQPSVGRRECSSACISPKKSRARGNGGTSGYVGEWKQHAVHSSAVVINMANRTTNVAQQLGKCNASRSLH